MKQIDEFNNLSLGSWPPISEPLTWAQLANHFDNSYEGTRRTARSLPMDVVFSWAAKQTDKFFVDDDGFLHLIERKHDHP